MGYRHRLENMPFRPTKKPNTKFRSTGPTKFRTMRRTPSGVDIMYDTSGPPRRVGGRDSGAKRASFHETTVRDACVNTDPVFRLKASYRTPKHWLPEKNPAPFQSCVNAFSASSMSVHHIPQGPEKSWLPIEWTEYRQPSVAERRAQMNKKMENMRQMKDDLRPRKPPLASIYETKPKHAHCCPTALHQQRIRRREALGLGLSDSHYYGR